MRTVAVTGTGGYIGGRLARYLEEAGLRVVRLSRSAEADLRFDLTGPPVRADAFSSRNVSVLVHAAYDFSFRSRADIQRVNVKGTLDLFDSALAGGVSRVVFVSSLAAHPTCRSLYGKAKNAVEGHATNGPVVIVKPGTVYGPNAGGMMGTLTAQIDGSRIMPVIRHPGSLYLTHEADLFRLFETVISGDLPKSPIFAAGETPWTLPRICRALRGGRGPAFLPTPWWAIWVALKVVETCGGRLRFRSDSALSLGYPAPPEYVASLTRPSFPFREFLPGGRPRSG
ncbi:MAG: NAD-dependent epimerase/dehydratase family protein [Methylococcales bacterium]